MFNGTTKLLNTFTIRILIKIQTLVNVPLIIQEPIRNSSCEESLIINAINLGLSMIRGENFEWI